MPSLCENDFYTKQMTQTHLFVTRVMIQKSCIEFQLTTALMCSTDPITFGGRDTITVSSHAPILLDSHTRMQSRVVLMRGPHEFINLLIEYPHVAMSWSDCSHMISGFPLSLFKPLLASICQLEAPAFCPCVYELYTWPLHITTGERTS